MKYKAHDYQAYATNFILEHPISAVFLDMGLGKSIITLSAMRSKGLISAKEYAKIDTIIAEKYGISSCSIFR